MICEQQHCSHYVAHWMWLACRIRVSCKRICSHSRTRSPKEYCLPAMAMGNPRAPISSQPSACGMHEEGPGHAWCVCRHAVGLTLVACNPQHSSLCCGKTLWKDSQ